MLIADAGSELSLEEKADDPESRNFAGKAVLFTRKRMTGAGNAVQQAARSATQAYQAHVPVNVQLLVYGAAKDLEAAVQWSWNRVPAVYRDRYSIIQNTGWFASKGTQVWLLNHVFKGGIETAVATRGWELAAVWFASAAAFEAVTAGAHFATEFGTTYRGDLGRFIEVRKGLLAAQNIPKAFFGILTWGLNLGLDKTELVPASTAIYFTGIPFSYEQTRFTTLFKNARDRGESGWHYAISYIKNRPSQYATQMAGYFAPAAKWLTEHVKAIEQHADSVLEQAGNAQRMAVNAAATAFIAITALGAAYHATKAALYTAPTTIPASIPAGMAGVIAGISRFSA